MSACLRCDWRSFLEGGWVLLAAVLDSLLFLWLFLRAAAGDEDVDFSPLLSFDFRLAGDDDADAAMVTEMPYRHTRPDIC